MARSCPILPKGLHHSAFQEGIWVPIALLFSIPLSFYFFNFSHSNRHVVTTDCDFNFQFCNDTKHIFIWLFITCIAFVQCLLRPCSLQVWWQSTSLELTRSWVQSSATLKRNLVPIKKLSFLLFWQSSLIQIPLSAYDLQIF